MCASRQRQSASAIVVYLIIIHDKNVFELSSSLAPWELAPCELTLRLRAVVVTAGSVRAGSLAPWQFTSYFRYRWE